MTQRTIMLTDVGYEKRRSKSERYTSVKSNSTSSGMGIESVVAALHLFLSISHLKVSPGSLWRIFKVDDIIR